MTEAHTHRLEGCSPTPLANYLKALGVLRLLATPANNVKGEAADPTARGWWEGEHFHLRTQFDRDALLRFFLEDYAPSPIIAPWNGGGGFYFREGKTGEKDPATGKLVKTGIRNAPTKATQRVDAIAGSASPRLGRIAQAIKLARMLIAEFDLTEAPDPKTGQKAKFIEHYRSSSPEDATDWVDAVVIVSGDQFDAAALLGSGGNDGNLDFSTAFQAAMFDVISVETGSALADAAAGLDYALFDHAFAGAHAAGISQLAPGQIAGANSGNGFSGNSRGDPWSIILMFEGAIVLAGTATRRSAANRARGSFPFTVTQLASGSGAVGGDDESSSRSDELWLPLWNRPSVFSEVRALLSEGRAHLGRAEARDGLTFARAVSSLGVSRGISEFARLGFEARYGNMFITVPLGRFKTPKTPRNDLIHDLDVGGWLAAVRRITRENNAPTRVRAAVRRFEDALFDVTQQDRQRDGLQAAFAALGGLVSWLSTSKKGRESVRSFGLRRRWQVSAGCSDRVKRVQWHKV
jgi:CRISPR-associated protein Csx17